MLSPSAMEEAARKAGMWRWDHAPKDPDKEPLWHLPGDPLGVPLSHPFMVSTVADWLRSDVVATGGVDAHMRYLEACRELDPVVIYAGVVFVTADFSICASMVALGEWKPEHARLVLGLGSVWRKYDE